MRLERELGQSRTRMLEPEPGSVAQSWSKAVERRIRDPQAADRLQLAQGSPKTLVEIGRLAVGSPVGLATHLPQNALVLEAHHGAVRTQQAEQTRDGVRPFPVVDDPSPSGDGTDLEAEPDVTPASLPIASGDELDLQVVAPSGGGDG